jgi:hypothetical protein
MSWPRRITFEPSGLEISSAPVHTSTNSHMPARRTFSSRGTTKWPISAHASAGQYAQNPNGCVPPSGKTTDITSTGPIAAAARAAAAPRRVPIHTAPAASARNSPATGLASAVRTPMTSASAERSRENARRAPRPSANPKP